MKKLKQFFKWSVIPFFYHLFGKVAPLDFVNAFYHIAKKTLPYLIGFRRADKDGFPAVLNNEIKEKMVKLGYSFDEETHCHEGIVNGIKAEDFLMDEWHRIIDEMIFAFQYAIDENDDDCMIVNDKYNPNQKEFFHTEKTDDGSYEMIFNEDYGRTKIDIDLYNKKQERVQEGYNLYSRYFRNLWD